MNGAEASGPRLGLDLGGTSMLAVVLGADGRTLARAEAPTGAHDPLPLLDRLAGLAEDAASVAGIQLDNLVFVGVGLPGEVEGDHLRATPILRGWSNVPVGALLRARLGRPVAVENDANAALLGELHLGAARGADPVLLITLGTGIGGAVAVGGRRLRGHRGSAGEIGHLSLDPQGPPCPCGGRGCLGQLASTPALLRRYRALGGPETDGRGLARALQAGDEAAAQAIDELCARLAEGIAAAAVVLAPEVVVLAGGVVEGVGETLARGIQVRLARRPYPAVLSALTVRAAALGAYAGAVGAALLPEAP